MLTLHVTELDVESRQIVINFSAGCAAHATTPLLSPRSAHGTVCMTHCTNCHHWNKLLKTHLCKISFVQQDSL